MTTATSPRSSGKPVPPLASGLLIVTQPYEWCCGITLHGDGALILTTAGGDTDGAPTHLPDDRVRAGFLVLLRPWEAIYPYTMTGREGWQIPIPPGSTAEEAALLRRLQECTPSHESRSPACAARP